MADNNKRKRERRDIAITEANKFSAVGDDLHRSIAEKAYELFEWRGCCHGNDIEDWLKAERIGMAEVEKGNKPVSRR